MRIRYQTAHVAAAAAIAVAFAGCSGAQNSVSPSPPGSGSAAGSNASTGMRTAHSLSLAERPVHSIRPYTKKASIFVTNYASNDVEVYNPKVNDPSPSATITDGVDTPSGDCLDKKGTLYVVNENVNSIPEYKTGQASPFQTITEGLETPGFCAIDSKGNLWVTNLGSVNVTEYPKGSTSPSTIITDGITFPIGIAFDRKGDMYVSNRSGASGTNVQVYPPGGSSPTMTITDGITDPCGIAVDAKGTLYVTNLSSDTVTEYLAGQSSRIKRSRPAWITRLVRASTKKASCSSLTTWATASLSTRRDQRRLRGIPSRKA
jgi:streptogramin lyase